MRRIIGFTAFFILLFLIALIVFLLIPYKQSSGVKLTDEENNWLKNNPEKLVLWYDWKFPPLEFQSPEGTFSGMGSDVIKSVEQQLGVSFKKQVSRDWELQLASLKSGESAIAPVIVDTPDRRDFAFFTKPFAEVPVVIITSRNIKGTLSLDDLENKRVAVVAGFATEEYLKKHAPGKFFLVRVNNVQDGLRDLSFGVVDAFVENLAVAAYYIDKEGLSNLRVAGSTNYSFKWSIAVSKQYPTLFRAIEKAFNAIPDKELEHIHSRWIRLQVPGMLSEEAVIALKLAALFSLILMGSLAILNWLLKRKLNEKMENLRKTEESLKKSESLANAIMDQSFQFLGLLDIEGHIIKVNKKALDFAGITLEHVYGTLFWETAWWKSVPDAEQFIKKAIRDAMQGIITRREVVLTDKTGQKYIIDFTLSPFIDENGIVLYVIPEGRDITEIRQAEKDREKLREQLVQAQKMDAVGQLAGGIAHDFNNMLGAITGAADLLAVVNANNPAASRYCQIILKSSERATQLISKLLTFSRKGKTESTPVDVHTLIGETATMLERSIDRRITIITELSAPISVVSGDPGQIQNALLNLGLNARDAMPEGGILSYRTELMELDTEACGSSAFPLVPGNYLRIHITDTGIGIAPELRGKIFEPFFTTKEIGKGTGLGLAAVYGTVLDHKGAIALNSTIGKGTEFIIDLPIAENLKQQAHDAREIPRGNGLVLLVDDEDVLRNTGTMLLEDLGYTPICASNGNEGIIAFQTHHKELCAVLCDMVMPIMSGRDALREMRAIDPKVPLIVCSGFLGESNAQVIKEKLADAFLPKPFRRIDLAELLAKISRKNFH